MIVIGDPRRVRVKWDQWRIRVDLLPPIAVCMLLAGVSFWGMRDFPIRSAMVGGLSLVIAFLFARRVWRERHPLRTEERGSADPVE